MIKTQEKRPQRIEMLKWEAEKVMTNLCCSLNQYHVQYIKPNGPKCWKGKNSYNLKGRKRFITEQNVEMLYGSQNSKLIYWCMAESKYEYVGEKCIWKYLPDSCDKWIIKIWSVNSSTSATIYQTGRVVLVYYVQRIMTASQL